MIQLVDSGPSNLRIPWVGCCGIHRIESDDDTLFFVQKLLDRAEEDVEVDPEVVGWAAIGSALDLDLDADLGESTPVPPGLGIAMQQPANDAFLEAELIEEVVVRLVDPALRVFRPALPVQQMVQKERHLVVVIEEFEEDLRQNENIASRVLAVGLHEPNDLFAQIFGSGEWIGLELLCCNHRYRSCE